MGNNGPMANNGKGILWALFAAALYTIAAAMAKTALNKYGLHVLQVLFFRQGIVFLSSLPAIAPRFPECLKTNRPGLHGIRLVGAFVALSCGIWAVAVLPLTTAVTVAFAQVPFVFLLSVGVLGERGRLRRGVATVVGFCGIVIAMHPGMGGVFDVRTLIPLAGAAGGAVAVVAVRRLSQTETTSTLLAYQSIFMGALCAIALFWLWRDMPFSGWVLMVAMGGIAASAQWIGVHALRLGEAGVIGNMEYMKIIYAAVLGYALFAEVPGANTLVGAGIIIGSSAYMFYAERPVNRKASLS